MTKTSKLIAGLTLVAGFGVAVLPLASYADNPQNVAISATVEESATIVSPTTDERNGQGSCVNDTTTPTEVTVPISNFEPGNSIGIGSCVIKTGGNVSYKLTVIDEDATTALTDSSNNTIPAVSGTDMDLGNFLSGNKGKVLSVNTSEWGINVQGVVVTGTGTQAAAAANSSAKFAYPTASGSAAAVIESGVTGQKLYTFTFGVGARSDQADGTYTDTIVLTVE
jgi:hypothetical protein